MPASSASRAAARLSSQLASQRSGAVVATEPEQFMPKRPSLNRFAFCIRCSRRCAVDFAHHHVRPMSLPAGARLPGRSAPTASRSL